MKNGAKSIDYTLKAAADEGSLAEAEDLANNGEVLTVASGSTEGSASIKGDVEGNPSTGGHEYSDTLTFTVDVE